jgi:hypothetical protein
MALGNLTYKTPNPVSNLENDLTDSEGCGVYLSDVYTVSLATTTARLPYGIVIVGANSTDGTGSGQIAAGALEIVDAYGAVVQAKAGAGGVAVGDSLQVNNAGAFVAAAGAVGEYVWGYALTPAPAGQQFLMRFAPYTVFASA